MLSIAHRSRSKGLFLAVTVFCVLGCGRSREGLITQVDEPQLTEGELYWRVIDQSPVFANAVESAADSILALSDDPQIRRRALLWKINAIPAAQSAIFRIDPLLALLDVWTFSVQMTDYFETGAGKNDFGEWQPIAIDACRELEEQFSEIAVELAGDVTTNRGNEFVKAWASENLIEDISFTRESTRGYWSEVVKEGGGVVNTVETLTDAMRVMADRMDASYVLALKQARWQAQLFVEDDLAKNPDIDGMFTNLDRVAEMDGDVSDIALDIDEIEEQFGLLQRDFAAIVDSINAYWATATRVLEAQRLDMEPLIDRQRKAAMADLEVMSAKIVDQSISKLRGAITWMILPGVLGLIALMAGPFAIGFFAGRGSSRQRRHPDG